MPGPPLRGSVLSACFGSTCFCTGASSPFRISTSTEDISSALSRCPLCQLAQQFFLFQCLVPLGWLRRYATRFGRQRAGQFRLRNHARILVERFLKIDL